MIRVVLPQHLRTLARVEHEVQVEVNAPATIRSVLDAVEARYPMLRGTMRDHATRERRPFLRFFADDEDWSLRPADDPLPESVSSGAEPLLVIGAISGGSNAQSPPVIGRRDSPPAGSRRGTPGEARTR